MSNCVKDKCTDELQNCLKGNENCSQYLMDFGQCTKESPYCHEDLPYSEYNKKIQNCFQDCKEEGSGTLWNYYIDCVIDCYGSIQKFIYLILVLVIYMLI
ncbi:hypothetical protein PPERSA_03966 [Pseudocohnilembus persalinus]|uniref:Uncharacterized protein n=1 Tax=Pseudocohnilembus persalinus TaxID=266149 RepID=A0A0V0QAJ2_PSEPJ|nr:hypothetical protein PPERSA_03966 [Pseudocohnilembus persalinus]|eukprot:KRW99260.1 hypothetical protein PPERSA_03966 [Pseudocohnilembus persalinus]